LAIGDCNHFLSNTRFGEFDAESVAFGTGNSIYKYTINS